MNYLQYNFNKQHDNRLKIYKTCKHTACFFSASLTISHCHPRLTRYILILGNDARNMERVTALAASDLHLTLCWSRPWIHRPVLHTPHIVLWIRLSPTLSFHSEWRDRSQASLVSMQRIRDGGVWVCVSSIVNLQNSVYQQCQFLF